MSQKSRKQQKQQTKENILKTAFQTISQQGFYFTTVDDIIKKAGYSHGTFFVHFKSKDNLLIELIESTAGEMKELYQKKMPGTYSIQEVLSIHLDVIHQYEAFYTHLIKEENFLPDTARGAFFELQNIIADYIKKAIKEEKAKLQIIDSPLYLMISTWMGLIHYYLQNSDLFAPGHSVIEIKKEELVDHYLTIARIGTEAK
ncbi:MAG: TetR/AcrR family transcriptional regulator [Spirochaetes bacterium]|nr:TetR/AcrR family transcriptional regulator [Spirochaetota bacterium]